MAKKPRDRYRDVLSFKKDLTVFIRGDITFREESYPAGTVIIREGDSDDSVYYLVRGSCEISKWTTEKVVLSTVGPGEVFGEMVVLSPGPRTATVTALEDTLLYVIAASTCERELDSMKPWMKTIVRSLAHRSREFDRKTYPPAPSIE